MLMKIVTKNTGKIVRELTRNEREAVITAYCHSKEATEEQINVASRISALAKTSGSWILCDCQSSAPAYLFPRLTESGHVTLVRPRPPRQQAHANCCPFFLEDSEPSLAAPVPPTSKPISDFCFLKLEKPKSELVGEPSNGRPNTVKHLPKLTKLMFMLLEGAGLNCLDEHFPYDRHPNATYKFAKTIPLYPGANLTVADYLSTVSQPSHYYALVTRLRGDQRLVDSGQRKQGFVLSLANEFDEKSVTLSCGLVLKVVGTIAAPTRVPTGPYWCLLLIGEHRAGSNFFEALRASLWPAYTEKTPFVVDSQPERETLKNLISWNMYWKDKGEHYIISKPLDFHTHVRPDFVVTDPESGKRAVIETMGSKDQAYLDKKIEMHEMMASNYGKVVEHRPGDDVLTFKKAVTAALLKD
jgi:hypothetical protein